MDFLMLVIFFLSVIMFIMNYVYFVKCLISIEFMLIISLYLVYLFLGDLDYLVVYIMIMGVCEGVMGLCVMVIMVDIYGVDYYGVLNYDNLVI